MNTSLKFYTYVLLDPRKPGPFQYGHWKFSHEPFYVGKGNGNRYLAHFKLDDTRRYNNPHNTRKIKKIFREGHEIEVRIVRKDISDKEAMSLEIKLIKLMGRHNLGTGPLTNLTDGGEGSSNQGLSTRRKRSRSMKKVLSEKPKEFFEARGKKASLTMLLKSDEEKEAIRALTHETRASKTKSERKRTSRKISKAAKAQWEALSEEDKERFYQERSATELFIRKIIYNCK